MKKKLFLAVLLVLNIVYIHAEKNPKNFFNNFDSNINNYSYEVVEVEKSLSEGQVLFVFSNNENYIYRVETFSSLGKTMYTSYCDESGYWYIQKKAFFYNGAFAIDDATIEVSYFKFKDEIFKYNETTNSYDKGLDIETSPAVIDFRTAEDIVDINLRYLRGHKD